VFEFMQKHFRYDEPITRAVGATEEDTYDFFTDLISHGFSWPYSLVVRVKGAPEVVGVALNTVCEEEDQPNANGTTAGAESMDEKTEFGKEISAGPYKSANANRLIAFIEYAERDLFSLFIPPASDPTLKRRVFKLDVLAVKAEHNGRGLGTKLVQRSLEIARESGCEWVVTCASAKGSHSIFTKFGLKTVRTVRFESFLENGVPVYRNLHDGGIGGHLMVLKL